MKKIKFVIICLLFANCHSKVENTILLKTQSERIKLEIDSVSVPELPTFLIRLKLTNNTNKNLMLVFDSVPEYDFTKDYNLPKSNEKHKLFFIDKNKDSLNLYVNKGEKKEMFFEKNSITSFNVIGFFNFREKPKIGFFNDLSYFQDSKKFPKSKIIYIYSGNLSEYKSTSKGVSKADTILVPNKLEANSDNVTIVDRFPPNSLIMSVKKL